VNVVHTLPGRNTIFNSNDVPIAPVTKVLSTPHESMRENGLRDKPIEQPAQHKLPAFPILQADNLSNTGRARAFLQIQDGCYNACTFCVVRIARGRSVSFPFDRIIDQARKFAEAGYCEINLTGVDITSYNYGPAVSSLGALVQHLLEKLPSHVRIRLSSLDPAAIDDALYDAMADERLLPHWHLSLQSGDRYILSRMKRRHSPEDIAIIAERIRDIRPSAALGGDIIAGFPGETEKMFSNTCDLVTECRISLLHVFPYSDRPYTEASQMNEKLSAAIKNLRVRILRQIGADILLLEMRSLVGQKTKMLAEKVSSNDGLSRHLEAAGLEEGSNDGLYRRLEAAGLDGGSNDGLYRRLEAAGLEEGRNDGLSRHLEAAGLEEGPGRKSKAYADVHYNSNAEPAAQNGAFEELRSKPRVATGKTVHFYPIECNIPQLIPPNDALRTPPCVGKFTSVLITDVIVKNGKPLLIGIPAAED
jgi:MiaB/RimO family radical SAM methylthiotransferase